MKSGIPLDDEVIDSFDQLAKDLEIKKLKRP
jgi:hypothetical protein